MVFLDVRYKKALEAVMPRNNKKKLQGVMEHSETKDSFSKSYFSETTKRNYKGDK